MSFPRTTHQWLAPLYGHMEKVLDFGAPSGYSGMQGVGVAQGVPIARFGNASGTIGMYGSTGPAGQLATGTAGITGLTGAGGMTAFSMVWINGGSGAYYRLTDIVTALKNVGILKP